MPLLFFLALILLLILLSILLIPLSLLQRYRMGTMRRLARGWLATLNVVGITLSACLFLVGAAVTNVWVPDAFAYTVFGLAGGAALGLLGLAWTRWEPMTDRLYYTPNRWLVLAVTLLVASRILYGFWRSWQTWQHAPDAAWTMASGVAGSLGAGAVVLGYYLAYWVGVKRRLSRQRRVAARP